ncbi:flagellar hook-basal body complex protein FliE [bacterium]|nr:flagellar hook-basal body complex protein FliE [bacterium]
MADDLKIQQIRSLLDPQGAGRAPEIQSLRPPIPQNADTVEGPSFEEALKASIAEVNDLKVQADKAIEDLASGKSGDIQGTILAMEKADVSFKLMMEVRNKIVSAYQEIMRTQV